MHLQRQVHEHAQGLGLFVTGAGTNCELHSSSFKGGVQAVNVSGGRLLVMGRFEVADLDLHSFAGEVSGPCSALTLSPCTPKDLQECSNASFVFCDRAHVIMQVMHLLLERELSWEAWPHAVLALMQRFVWPNGDHLGEIAYF